MAQTLTNIDEVGTVIAKAQAKIFEDNLGFCKSIGKADESDFNGKNGFKAGSSININRPMRSRPTSEFDQTSTIQDVVETTAPLTLDIISSQAFEVDTQEFATKIGLNNVLNRIVKPAAVSMAHDFENKVLAQATNAVSNSVGQAGSNTFDVDTILEARQVLNENLCPKDDQRYFNFTSSAGRKAVNARKGLFQSADEIAKQYKQGYIGMADGFRWMESEMLQSHTNGNDVTFEVSTTVSTEGQSTLVVQGLTNNTGTVLKGTVFTIDGVFAVNPQTGEVYDRLQQFVVTEDATANGSGVATLNLSPGFFTSASNGLQNVSAFPADGGTCNVVGAANTGYKQNIAYHKNAFRLATVPLIMPKNAEFAAQETYKGITMSVVYDWDQKARSMILRMDILGGLCIERSEWAVRVTA